MTNRLLSICALLVFPLLDAQHAPAPTEETFDELRALVLPAEEELAWSEHGWLPSLWQGVLEAQRLERPILLWAMNGHPLGCT